jgi:hypothetical protein
MLVKPSRGGHGEGRDGLPPFLPRPRTPVGREFLTRSPHKRRGIRLGWVRAKRGCGFSGASLSEEDEETKMKTKILVYPES